MTTNEIEPLGGLRRVMFSQKEIAKLVEETVPPDRTNAIVGTVDADGVAVVLKMQKGEHWTVEMAVKREWGGDIKSGAKVVYSW